MAQQLIVTAFPEDPSTVAGPNSETHSHLYLQLNRKGIFVCAPSHTERDRDTKTQKQRQRAALSSLETFKSVTTWDFQRTLANQIRQKCFHETFTHEI